ncbi:MAG: bifunctional precorrin-2 dehydrogenase/sirohydrochlorin ferrochelatase [Actinobacteria bacterium]|nr:MAG: bifunctional precorrin-2 dehydrogenase/sirohydrochlorin ferrochelatase [Actinomycetota bacterium]
MREQRYYMACLDLTGRECVVVGGGKVGLEKVRGLLECGASVRVVAPEIERKLADLPVRWLESRYQGWDLDDAWLAVAATPDREVNRRVFEDAQQRGIFCNVADDPELCSLILPAVHRVDPIAIAVSTGGASPALAQRIRSEIAELVGPAHARLARELRELRPWAKENLPTYEARKEYFEELVSRSLS